MGDVTPSAGDIARHRLRERAERAEAEVERWKRKALEQADETIPDLREVAHAEQADKLRIAREHCELQAEVERLRKAAERDNEIIGHRQAEVERLRAVGRRLVNMLWTGDWTPEERDGLERELEADRMTREAKTTRNARR